jgi:hypothetical protein
VFYPVLSEYRSDIGAGVSMMKDEGGQDQIYVVIETALQTRSGQQQSWARDFLTRLPSIIAGTTSMNGTPVPLSEGQYIIPVIQSTSRPAGDVLHELQYGQTLWSIAITYGTTIEQIQRWNNLGASTILYEKQLLLVQKGATQPAAVPTHIATVVPSESASSTPSPAATHTAIPTGTASQPAGRSSSIAVILIISVSLLAAGMGAGVGAKKVS